MNTTEKQKLEEALKKRENASQKIIIAEELIKQTGEKEKQTKKIWNWFLFKKKRLYQDTVQLQDCSKKLKDESEQLLAEAKILEDEALKSDDVLKSWFQDNVITQKWKEVSSSNKKYDYGRSTDLNSFRCDVKKKRNWQYFYIILLFLVQFGIATLVLYLLSDSPKLFGSSFVLNIKRGVCLMTLLLVLFLMTAYWIYCSIKGSHRYQTALHKIDVLIMRLRLYTDKDLEIPSRLDRELELIYRILES